MDQSDATDYIKRLRLHLQNDSTTIPYSHFHNALVLGNKPFVDYVLNSLAETGRMKLMNRCVDFLSFGTNSIISDRELFSRLQTTSSFVLTLPLSLACSSGNTDLVKSLLSHGLGIMLTDVEGNNIIHDLVQISSKNPKLAVEMYLLLITQFDFEKISAILKHENKSRFNPLDFATSSCCPVMMETIINTSDVYKQIVGLCGINRHVLYDVTSYERPEGRSKHYSFHLLRFISFYDDQQLSKINKSDILTRDPFKTWIQQRYRNFRLLMFLDCLFWIIHLAGMGALITYMAGFKLQPPVWLLYVVTALSAFHLLTEVTYVSRTWWSGRKSYYRKMCKGYRAPSLLSGRSRGPYIIFSITNIAICIIHMTHPPTTRFIMGTLVTLHVTGIICAMISLISFSRFNNKTGHFLAMFDKMATDTLAFAAVYVFVYLAFGIALFVAHMEMPSIHYSMNSTSTPNGTIIMSDDHPVFTKSLYDTFLLLIWITAPENLYYDNTNFPQLTVLIYMVAVVVSGIILINLLIGIMSQRVMEITEQRETILVVQMLSLMFLLEDILHIPYGFLSILHRITNGRLINVYNGFLYDDVTKRVLIPCVQNILQDTQPTRGIHQALF